MSGTIVSNKSSKVRSQKRQAVYAILPILFGVFIGWFMIEIALRVLDLSYRNRPLEPDPLLHHVHPKSYRFLSHFGGHEVYYDHNGLNSDPDGKLAKADNCRIAFLGDSFTESRQVKYRNSFVGLLDHRTDCVVRNYGVASYSPILYYLQWRHLVSQWKPDLLVVQLYSNDIGTDLDLIQRAQLDNDGMPIAIPGPSRDWLSTFLRKSYLLRFLRKVQLTISWRLSHWDEQLDVVGNFVEENPEITQVSSDLLTKLKNDVTQAGTEFVLFVVPSRFRLENIDEDHDGMEFADKWKSWATARQVGYIDLVPPFTDAASKGAKLYFEKDVHFNEEGHAVVAQEIEREIPSLFMSGQDAGNLGN